MNIINLDKFKEAQKVTLDGVEYEVKKVTVKDFLNDDVEKKINEQM